ncbi:MAG TPA: hypothetical protein VNQ99_09550 [Xanthobacteraceae bacterium]|nr:hypothetical protein [Xanthobacteraceae bacterium]
MRIIAGIAAVNTEFSPWLLAFSMFFFFSLANMKRYSECLTAGQAGIDRIVRRGYVSIDAGWLMAMGAGSGFCALVVFFIFLTDPISPTRNYATPQWLWLICIVLGYWLGRAWLLAGRGEMNDDPVVFALRDSLSLALGLICVVLVGMATFSFGG